MRLFYYRGARPNFGDDLNAELWPHMFSRDVLDADDVILVGIGSILSEEWLGQFAGTPKKVIILGSGTSYDLPPRSIDQWSVLAVRGPLTAALIDRPEAAVTDGAILLADAPVLVGNRSDRGDVLFIPHHRSVRRSNWHQIAAEAGMRYVSPQQPVRQVLDAFAGARLVVTEAMHGAIVADTLRIPWIPVTISPTIDEFKWRDWSSSMSVLYEPLLIPAGDPRDRQRYLRMEQVLQRRSLQGHRNLESASTVEDLQRYFERRFAPTTKSELLAADHGSALSRVGTAFATAISRGTSAKAVKALHAAARSRQYLSSDQEFQRRLDEMRAAVGRAVDIVRAG